MPGTERPVNVEAFPNAPGAITITWNHSGEGVYWFVVEQQSPPAYWTPDRDKRTWTITGLTPSTTYNYRVCAVYDYNRVCSDEAGTGYTSVTTMPPAPESSQPSAPPTEQESPQLPASVGAFESINFPGHLMRHRNYLGDLTTVSSALDRADATLREVSALDGTRDAVSFESINFPGHYLRHQNFRIKLQRDDGSNLFHRDASFKTYRQGVFAHRRFESVNYPGHYVRHANFQLWLAKDDGSESFQKDSTWRRLPPPTVNVPPGTLSFESRNFPGRFIRHRNELGEVTPVTNDLDKSDSSFVVRQALIRKGEQAPGYSDDAREIAVSLESINYPGHFLRHQNYRLKLQPNDGSLLFRQDASFFYQDGGCWSGNCPMGFESVNMPGYYIRHSDFQLWLAKRTDISPAEDSVWQPVPPLR
ncbi:AbfB domain-containing protein [Micromonospora sp. NPDC048999]|uniref:AbfB domain-containing protein n=1 Tax=Micromonospora sp. NPDC048999 TaxID=3155391 RepID=UPI00340154DE